MDKFSTNAPRTPANPAAWRLAAVAAALFAMVPVAKAAVEATTTLTNRIVCTTAPTTYNADGNPARVFVSGNFVYVLEQWNARVAVYDLVGRTNLFYYGAIVNNGAGEKYTVPGKWKMGTGDGGFKKPFGMALDTFSGENRFAVADSGNGRVQLFSFDPATGEITFEAASGNIFNDPNAVAFTESGDILVADSGNCRVVRLSGSLSQTAEYPLGEKAFPTGICSDSDTSDGFWVTDSKNQRVAYYRIADGTDAPAVSFGTVADKEVVTPRDVQIFGDSANGKFLCVVDNQGSRVRILEAVMSGGAYTEVVAAGDVGSAYDKSLQEYEQLWLPNGVFVDSDSGLLYVADYGHNLIKWYGVTATSPEPPEPTKHFNFTSVKTFDENGDEANTFTNRQTIGLVVTFETDDEIDSTSIICKKGDGSTFVATTADNVSGGSLDCEDISNQSQEYVGAIELVITVNCTGGTYSTNVVAAYTIAESTTEETETVRWPFTSIIMAGGAATLTWDFPSSNVLASGECLFKIQNRESLTSGDWDTLVSDLPATSKADCTYDADLSALGNPPACFFRLFWTNKVK